VRHAHLVVAAVVLAAGVTAACGQKGPPLPPLRPVPAAPTDVAARRIDDRVQLRFTIPSTNQDPSTPLVLSRVDIYARSVGYGSAPPSLAQLVHRDFLVHSIEVRPTPPPNAPPPDPAVPVEPRPGAGDVVSWSETLPVGAERPLAPTRESQAAGSAPRAIPLVLWPSSVAVPFSRIVLPTRYYVMVPVSAQGRNGAPSAILPVRLGGSPPVPSDATLSHTETTLTLTWTSPAGAGAMIYESTPDGVEASAPVEPTPISTGTWSTPVIFGVERCFTIRQVQVDAGVSTESAPAGPVCRTPLDTYAPGVPTGLVGLAQPASATEPGRAVLEWAAVVSPDLAGYHVLRGEGPDATLQPLTTAVVTSTGYVDSTIRPDVEYIYAVVAVDRAGNRSEPSATIKVTGRKP
jgi:predicted small lipoprotein YifL